MSTQRFGDEEVWWSFVYDSTISDDETFIQVNAELLENLWKHVSSVLHEELPADSVLQPHTGVILEAKTTWICYKCSFVSWHL